MTSDVSIVIPFFNESDNIERLARLLNNYLGRQPWSAELVFVDDGSVDGSCDLLKRQVFDAASARLVRLEKNSGSHAALRAGILQAEGAFITSLSADLQDPPELVSELFSKAKEGFDIVFAARNAGVSRGFDGVFSKWYSKLMKRYAFADYPENGFDVTLFSADIQKRLNRKIHSRASIFLELLGFQCKKAFIFYDKKERSIGKSKWTLSKKIVLFTDSALRFTHVPAWLKKLLLKPDPSEIFVISQIIPLAVRIPGTVRS